MKAPLAFPWTPLLAALLLGGCTVVAGVPPEPAAVPAEARPAEPAGRAAEEPQPTPAAIVPAPDITHLDAPARPAAASPVPRPFDEVRALWVVRSTLERPERIRALIERARAGGFNTLLVQVRGRGDAYYDGTVEPRAAEIEGDFDPLGLVLELAHAQGIAVHAWVNTHLVADAGLPPGEPDHLLHTRPDLLAVPRALAPRLVAMDPHDPRYVAALREHARANRDRVEGLFTNPAHPDVRARMKAIWLDLARRYPIDGLHFDYVRYPAPDYDYSADALARFRAHLLFRVDAATASELDRHAEADPLTWPKALPEEWDDFRREQITSLVRELGHAVKAERPELIVSAAVFADAADARGARYQDWVAWLGEGLLDFVAPMAYTTDDARFERQIARAVEAAGDPRRVWAGIGAWQTGYDGTLRKIDLARATGAGGVVLFSYDWAAGQTVPGDDAPFLEGVGRRAFEER